MRRVWQRRHVGDAVNVRVVFGILLISSAVGITFLANQPSTPDTVAVVVADTDVASGSTLEANLHAFTTVPVNADSPLLEQMVTAASIAGHHDAVLVRSLKAGEPVLVSALGDTGPSGTVLTVLLPRVAVLDGDVSVGERVRVLSGQANESFGIAVDVVALRSLGGGLGRQEQVAVTLRVESATQAARLFATAQQDQLLIVRDMARR